MNTRHTVSLLLAAGFCAALLATPARAGDVADIRIARDGAEHALSVDLEQLADGQTLQLSTAAGLPAIVHRDGQALSIELAGQRFEVQIGAREAGLWLGKPDGSNVQLIRLGKHAGAEAGTEGEGKVRVIAFDSEAGETLELDGGRKVMLVRRSGDGPLDEAAIAELIEEARAKVDHHEGDGTRITVTRRITRDAEG